MPSYQVKYCHVFGVKGWMSNDSDFKCLWLIFSKNKHVRWSIIGHFSRFHQNMVWQKNLDQTLPSKRGQNGLKTLVKGFPFIVEFLPPRLNF